MSPLVDSRSFQSMQSAFRSLKAFARLELVMPQLAQSLTVSGASGSAWSLASSLVSSWRSWAE